jgi:hypothetical protein
VAKQARAGAAGSIYVLAGCNGAGRSSFGGSALRQSGAEFFNPDDAAQRIAIANIRHHPSLTQTQINAAAWEEGRRLLQRAIAEHAHFAFETTLGGKTMTALLEQAAGTVWPCTWGLRGLARSNGILTALIAARAGSWLRTPSRCCWSARPGGPSIVVAALMQATTRRWNQA